MKPYSVSDSVRNAVSGVAHAVKHERHMWVHTVMGSIAILLAAWLRITWVEWVCLTIVIVQVLLAELFNTAMEIFVDMVSPGWTREAKIIKDLAAGAVLVSSLGALVVGCILLVPRILAVLLL